MPAIEIYTRSWCPYCEMAKRLLRSKGQEWTEIDVECEPGRAEEMIERSGRRTVPQIFIGDRYVGGFDDLATLEDEGRLDALLGRARGRSEVEHRRAVIVGSGPAGYTAAGYAARAGLAPPLPGRDRRTRLHRRRPDPRHRRLGPLARDPLRDPAPEQGCLRLRHLRRRAL